MSIMYMNLYAFVCAILLIIPIYAVLYFVYNRVIIVETLLGNVIRGSGGEPQSPAWIHGIISALIDECEDRNAGMKKMRLVRRMMPVIRRINDGLIM